MKSFAYFLAILAAVALGFWFVIWRRPKATDPVKPARIFAGADRFRELAAELRDGAASKLESAAQKLSPKTRGF
jgi:hypothetical protein